MIVVEIAYIADTSFLLEEEIMNNARVELEVFAQFMKNPLFWPLERVLARSELSPLIIV